VIGVFPSRSRSSLGTLPLTPAHPSTRLPAMTTALLVAVVLLAALTVFNLVLVLGVVRRLRTFEHRAGGPGERPPALTAPAGERVGDFTASTVDDRRLSRAA